MKKDFSCADDLCSDYNYTCGPDTLTCKTCNKFCNCSSCENKGPCTEPCGKMIKAGKDWAFDKPNTGYKKNGNKFEETDLFDYPF